MGCLLRLEAVVARAAGMELCAAGRDLSREVRRSKRLVARGLVGGVGVGGVFAGAHEAVAGSIVGDGVVLLAGGLHALGGGGNGGVDAGVVAAVEAVDGCGDGGEVRRRRSVEDKAAARSLR